MKFLNKRTNNLKNSMKNIFKNRKTRLYVIIPIAVAVVLIVGFVIAKYVMNGAENWGQVNAPNFYFTADLLGDTKMYNSDGTSADIYNFTEDSTKGTWLLFGGKAHNLTINVRNYFDDLRITELQTIYSVSVSSNMSAANTNQITFSPNQGSLNANTMVTNAITVTIPEYSSSFDYTDGDIVTIKIKSSKPYVKTLTLNFVLYSVDTKLHYKIVDNAQSPFAELIIMTGVTTSTGADTTVQPYIKWSDELSIDNTNGLTFSTATGSIVQQPNISTRNMQISQELNTGRSESIFFFKSDITKNYTTADTVVIPDASGKYTIDISGISGNN